MICVPYKEIIEEMIGSKCQQGISNTGQLAFPQNVRHKRSMQLCVARCVHSKSRRVANCVSVGTDGSSLHFLPFSQGLDGPVITL